MKRLSLFELFTVMLFAVITLAVICHWDKTVVMGASTGIQTPQPPAKAESTPIVKAFPPDLSAQMEDADKALALAQANLNAAQANFQAAQLNVQNTLFKAGVDLAMTKKELETCPYSKNKNGAWVFTCPAPQQPEKKP